MYQALLTRRYVTSKVMPLLAALAIMLCTAMVLVVWSVMGGFLATLIGSGRTLVGDVAIVWPTTGFAYYEDLVARLEQDPLVAAAAPVIETYGLLALPDGRQEPVSVKAIDPRFARVADYEKSLYWRPLDAPLPKDAKRQDPRLAEPKLMARLLDQGRTLTHLNPLTGDRRPAVVLGTELTGLNARQPEGFYYPHMAVRRNPDGTEAAMDVFMPDRGSVTLSVVPLDRQGRAVEMASSPFPVANEFQSGVYEFDNRNVFAPLADVQRMLKMHEVARVEKTSGDPVDFEEGAGGREALAQRARPIGKDPARVTSVFVRGKGDTTTDEGEALKAAVRRVYRAFAAAHAKEVPDDSAIRILTWADQNRGMIIAVKKETALVLSLFTFISLVAVLLILAIFWSMISEKTKDIGILRALGAGRSGVAGLWIGYGAALGVIGSLLGLALAYAIVTNINPIHEWMGRALGIVIWDPRVYYFTVIPNRVDPQHASIVLVAGILSGMLGALIPAWRAAAMHPVKALRFE